MRGDGSADRVRQRIRSARPSDLPAVLALLEAHALPGEGVAEWLDHYLVAESDTGISGVAGLELYADGALLRSVAVAGEQRGRGLGGRLVGLALERARAAGVPAVWLLTTTADAWFPRYGFRVAGRETAPPGVSGSIEFREACPASAVAMVLDLTEPASA